MKAIFSKIDPVVILECSECKKKIVYSNNELKVDEELILPICCADHKEESEDKGRK